MLVRIMSSAIFITVINALGLDSSNGLNFLSETINNFQLQDED